MSGQLDFNKDISRYLSARKRWRPSYKGLSLRFTRPTIKMGPDGALHSEERTIKQRFSEWYAERFPKNESAEVMVHDDFAVDSEPVSVVQEPLHLEEYAEDASYSESSGLWSRVSSIFERKPLPVAEEPIEAVHVQDMKSDLKHLANNFVGLMECMNHRQRERVKATKEFGQMKELFQKHNIIK